MRLPHVLFLAALLFAAPPALAQQPEPTPSSPTSKEQVQLYSPTQDKLVGRVSIPDQKLGVLVQPEGREWRQFRTETLRWVAAILIIGMVVLLAAFFLIRGRVEMEGGRSGLKVLRFNGIDRFAHWLTAVSFIILALTGVALTFGRPLLIPLIGHDAFYQVAIWGKAIHNYLSLPFVIGLLMILVLWVKDNFPAREDASWFRNMGGLLTRGGMHPACGRFNAGQKVVFWATVLGGGALAVTGFMMMNPFAWTDIDGMQTLQMIHGILAALMITLILAHIYIGSMGMEGAFDAMGSGEVDETWARDHHRLWYERQVSKGYADTSRTGARDT